MGQGGAQHSGAAAGGGDAGHHFDLDGVILLGHLVDEPRHAVHAGIAGAHHRHILAGEGGLHGSPAAVHLPAHPGGQHLFLREIRLDQFNIGGIAHDQVAPFQSGPGTAGEVGAPAGAQSDDSYFFHRIFLPATATVTPFFACLGTRMVPPAHTAARSHTLSTPVI